MKRRPSDFKPVYVQIAGGQALPFADSAFDILTSNAALERVGSLEDQRSFLLELLRVGKKIFVTVPNRLFTVEHHAAIPLLSNICYCLQRRGKARIGGIKELDPDVETLAFPHFSQRGSLAHTGLKLGPCSSNLLLMFIQQ